MWHENHRFAHSGGRLPGIPIVDFFVMSIQTGVPALNQPSFFKYIYIHTQFVAVKTYIYHFGAPISLVDCKITMFDGISTLNAKTTMTVFESVFVVTS